MNANLPELITMGFILLMSAAVIFIAVKSMRQ